MVDSELDLLQQMVQIASPSHHEKKLSLFLVEKMQSLGFHAYQDSVDNAIGTIGNGSKTIILLGHIDTFPGHIPVQIRNGCLYGRGSVDAKGSMACFISAANRLKEEVKDGKKKIIIIGAVEEEAATSRGTRQVLQDFNSPDYCVIGEPSSWNGLTLGYKGRLLLDYSLELPLKHTAAQGQTACEVALDYCVKVQKWCEQFNSGKTIFDGLLLSVRSFNSKSNGLTERIDLRLGFRLPINFDLRKLENFLQTTAQPAVVSFSGREAAVRKDKNNLLVRNFLRSIRGFDGKPKFKVKTGTSDMNVVAPHWHCPMVAFGPGDSSLDHTPDEHIEIEEYGRAIDVLESVLRAM